MKFKSQVYTEASGSVGGLTYSRNKGGMYTRARAKPTNPNSVYQQTLRTLMGQAMARWNTALSDVQRAAWKTYADNTPVKNVMGENITLTGPQMYCRTNIFGQQSGVAWIDDAPTTFGLPAVSPMTISAVASDHIKLTFTNTDPWSRQNDAICCVFDSRPQNASIQYFKGPYRLAGHFHGKLSAAVSSPQTLHAAFPFAAAQRKFVRTRVMDEEGRLSEEQFLTDVA